MVSRVVAEVLVAERARARIKSEALDFEPGEE